MLFKWVGGGGGVGGRGTESVVVFTPELEVLAVLKGGGTN